MSQNSWVSGGILGVRCRDEEGKSRSGRGENGGEGRGEEERGEDEIRRHGEGRIAESGD